MDEGSIRLGRTEMAVVDVVAAAPVRGRAMADRTERDRCRTRRVSGCQADPARFEGSRPRSGTRIRYSFRPGQFVVYWDDDRSAMVG